MAPTARWYSSGSSDRVACTPVHPRLSRAHAPSVSFPVGRSHFLGGCLLCWLALVLGGLTLFVWRPLPFPSVEAAGPTAALLGVAVAVCVPLCWCWWHTPTGWLTWAPVVTDPADCTGSGEAPASGWWWAPAHGADPVPLGEPVLVLDAGSRLALLVPAHPAGAPARRWSVRRGRSTTRWLWVDQSMFPSRWLALRRAVWAAQPE